MSFVTNFLDITEKLRPKIIRILKLFQTVEKRDKEIYDYLKNIRDGYLKDLKDKNEDNEELLYKDNTCYKELLNLSEYKQKLMQELNYIKNKLINDMNKIIEEGEKECQAELNKNKKNSEIKEEKFLNKKTKRNNQRTINKDDFKNFEDILPKNEEDDNIIYCICKNKESGNMIMCDNCQNWFHFKCIGMDENSNPNEFYCKACNEANKANKENNSNNSNNNKKTKKNKNSKKKKL